MSANKTSSKGSNKGLTSIDAIRKAAGRVRDGLDAKIAKLQAELDGLKTQRAEVGTFFGEAVSTPSKKVRKATKSAGGKKGNRVDWGSVLDALPEQFGSADVSGHSATASVPANQIAPAIHRWKAKGQVEVVERGVYRKVSASQPAPEA